MGLSRSIRLGGPQLQLRLVAVLNSPDFGRITALAPGTAPRIMQVAVKYVFLLRAIH